MWSPAKADPDAQGAADERKKGGFGEKLEKDVVPFGAQRTPQPDLTSALLHVHRHDREVLPLVFYIYSSSGCDFQKG